MKTIVVAKEKNTGLFCAVSAESLITDDDN